MAEYIYNSKGFSMPGWGGWSPMKQLGSNNLSIELENREIANRELGILPTAEEIDSPIKQDIFADDESGTYDYAVTENPNALDMVDKSSQSPTTTPEPSEGAQQIKGAVVTAATQAIMNRLLYPKKAPPPKIKSVASGFSKVKFG